MSRNLNKFIVGVSLSIAFTACKPQAPVLVVKRPDGTVVKSPPPPADESAEEHARALANTARTHRANGETAAADDVENTLVDRYPNTLAAAELYLRRGREAEEAGDVQTAIAEYEALIFYRPQFAQIAEARERYANLLLKVGRPKDAANMLRVLFDEGVANEDQIRLGLTLADALANAGEGLEALDTVVRMRSTSGLSKTQLELIDQRAPALTDALDYTSLQKAWSRSNDSGWSFVAPAIGFKLAKMHYHVRAFDESREVLADYLRRYSTGPFGTAAKEFSERLDARFNVKPRSIGVLVPLTGRFKPFGERAVAAIRLAFKDIENVDLQIRDTQAKANETSTAVEELVLEHNVIAIIGPLFSNSALAAAQKAEELSVPLLTLSYRDGIPEIGPWVFRTGLTIAAQAQGLAKVAFEELGFTKFALMWPRSRYGVTFATAFWKEVERRGGTITAAESYEHDQTTFRNEVRRMVGRYFLAGRWDYRQKVAELRAKKLPSHRFKAAVEKVQKNLPPIVDFDAIIIPDTAKNIGLIAPALAVEDIVMTHDPRMIARIKKATGRDDIHPVTLLGGSTWNHPLTPESCDRYCEESVFVDGYYPDNPDAVVRDFVSEFRSSFGAEPVLSDAQAFDTASILAHILRRKRPTRRDDLRTALHELPTLKGVTGTLKFGENGDAIKELFVLTIEDRTIQLWKPKSPQG